MTILRHMAYHLLSQIRHLSDEAFDPLLYTEYWRVPIKPVALY
jgi:hypothetical protein